MRLCSFKERQGEKFRLGIVEGTGVRAVQGVGSFDELLSKPKVAADLRGEGESIPLQSVKLGAPVRAGKILATIVNTQGMLGGGDVKLDRPRVDMKAPSAVIGNGDTVRAPDTGVRPEIELAAVIGARLSKASVNQAEQGILGYTILNDVTAPSDSRNDAYEAYRRDRQTGAIRKTVLRGPLFRSKNHDTFCPMGPWVVTADEVGDPGSLQMTTRFDGSLVQKGSTSEYLFSPAQIAAYVSGFLTLDPGDVVSCGSIGWTSEALGPLDPTEFILPKRNGTLVLEVGRIGVLENLVSYD